MEGKFKEWEQYSTSAAEVSFQIGFSIPIGLQIFLFSCCCLLIKRGDLPKSVISSTAQRVCTAIIFLLL